MMTNLKMNSKTKISKKVMMSSFSPKGGGLIGKLISLAFGLGWMVVKSVAFKFLLKKLAPVAIKVLDYIIDKLKGNKLSSVEKNNIRKTVKLVQISDVPESLNFNSKTGLKPNKLSSVAKLQQVTGKTNQTSLITKKSA